MTSRRPMTRTYSGNGRTNSFSEEEGSSSNGRSESRNTYLSDVRPENRSTLCTVMAQLTEDIQPSFDTTLKSKAVSENCNVKFSCVVSGYPAPELKWYKDDMEMDRYCGLPKYEIHRNGKTHTLQIYNCTLDDAAIYQVSASNSKGIVSCSGVLEVGTMNEYQIHQRFFAKLKQKAEKKKRDMEVQTKKEDEENIRKEKQLVSPERPPRKRHVQLPGEPPAVMEPEAVEKLGAAAEANGVGSEFMETAPLMNTVIDVNKETSPSEETLAKKKKITNGVDAEVNGSSSSRSLMMANGGENSYDGGMGLAQFLAETVQTQSDEEEQNYPQEEKPREINTLIVSTRKEQDREQDWMRKERDEPEKTLQKESVREKRREEVTIEKEKENERPKAMSHTVTHTKHGSDVQHHSKAHKDPDHHNIQTSFSSMLHTVKGFFFGKSKKDTHDNADNKERAFDQVEKKERAFDCAPASTQAPKPEMPPSFQLQLYNNQASKPLTEDSTPMESGKIKKPSETLDIEKQSVPIGPHKHKHEDSVPATELPHVHKLSPENTELSSGQSVKEDDTVEDMEVSAGAERSGPGEDTSLSGPKVLTEADSQVVPIHQQSLDCLAVSPQPNNQARDEYSTRKYDSVLPQTQAPFEEELSPITTIISLEENWPDLQSVVSASNSQGLEREDTECLQEEEMSVEVMGKEGEPDTDESCPLNICVEEEKAEVKSNKQPHADINRHETTELTTSSLEERIEPRKPVTADQVLMPLFTEATNSPERNNVREEAEHTSLFQEMNIGFPPTVAPESLNKGDLKKQQECNSSIAKETMGGHTVSPIQRQNSDINCGGLTKGLISPLPTDLEVNVCSDKIIQTQASSEGERIEAKDDSVQFEAEQEKMAPMKGEEFDESKNLSETLNSEGNAHVLEEDIIVTQHPGIDGQQVWPLDNFPQIHICTIEEMEDNTPILPDVSPIEHFVIPKIEIMEPDYKECSPPLTIFALNKQKKDLTILQNHDATYVPEVIIQDQDVSMFDPLSLQPTQKDMHTDFDLSPRQNVNKADETEMFEEPLVKSSEHLHQMDLKLIPVINVSFSEDKENDAYVNTHVSKMPQPFESAVVTQYVVPPISITCHEGDSALSTQSESTGTETSVVSETGTKHNVDNNLTTKPRKTEKREQDLEEIAEKMLKDQIPPMFYEDLMPKVGDNGSSVSKTTEDNNVPEILKAKPQTESNIENPLSLEDLQRNKPTVERLCTKPPAHPSLSPGSLRKFMLKASIESGTAMDPTIPGGDRQSDKGDDDRSGDSTPTSSRSCENSPCLKRRDSLTLIRSATPEELASGARRKIFMPKPKDEGDGAVLVGLDTQGKKESPYMSPGQARRAALLQSPTGPNTPPMEKRSPLMNRRKVTLEVSKVTEETPKEEPVSTKQEEKPVEKKRDPLKAPQVIRKIRGEPFPDASGHLKLWCQFFNVLSDSTIKWYRDEEEILELKRSGGDESQVALTIVLASSQDCGVYGCSISNEHGTDTTDYLLSIDILSEILLKGDLEVGEEIEMTPLIFTKGLADCGSWGDKYFGRIVTETVNIGEGYAHKACRVRVIYGLDPIFESGAICIIKVQNPIAHGTKQESNLADRNGEITKQECKVQNMIREYCKIFAAEGRVIESFGYSLEVIPQYLMYRPANTVPYATAETDLKGDFLKYCTMDPTGRLFTQTASEVEQKCNTFQHWIHQWTHGNLLVTRLEGVETKITNVRVVTKSKGYQGLTEYGSPEVFEQFVTNHQCNYYCGLLGLKPLKSMDSLQPTTKTKGSRSPMLNRKSSPQLQRKGHSPQMNRKSNTSPKVTRKALEAEDDKSAPKTKPAETVDVIEIR